MPKNSGDKVRNPVLAMSKPREEAWLKLAEKEDFFDMVALLAALYAKKNYVAGKGVQADLLFTDYEEYREKEREALKDTLHDW